MFAMQGWLTASVANSYAGKRFFDGQLVVSLISHKNPSRDDVLHTLLFAEKLGLKSLYVLVQEVPPPLSLDECCKRINAHLPPVLPIPAINCIYLGTEYGTQVKKW